jgi:hypothetical protein
MFVFLLCGNFNSRGKINTVDPPYGRGFEVGLELIQMRRVKIEALTYLQKKTNHELVRVNHEYMLENIEHFVI